MSLTPNQSICKAFPHPSYITGVPMGASRDKTALGAQLQAVGPGAGSGLTANYSSQASLPPHNLVPKSKATFRDPPPKHNYRQRGCLSLLCSDFVSTPSCFPHLENPASRIDPGAWVLKCHGLFKRGVTEHSLRHQVPGSVIHVRLLKVSFIIIISISPLCYMLSPVVVWL